jgi:hypothetical protein
MGNHFLQLMSSAFLAKPAIGIEDLFGVYLWNQRMLKRRSRSTEGKLLL